MGRRRKEDKLESKEVWKFFKDKMKSHKRELVVVSFVALFGSVVAAAIPYTYGRLFDLAKIPNTAVTILFSLIGVWAILGLVSSFSDSITSSLGSKLSAKVAYEIEVEAYSHLLTLPVSFHKSEKTGKTINRISRGSWNIESFLGTVSTLVPSAFFLFFALLIMAIVRWQLAAVLAVSLIVYAIITLKYTKPLYESVKSMRKISEREYGNLYDKIYNVFLIKNFSLEEKERKRIYNSLIKKVLESQIDTIQKSKKLQYLQGITYTLGFVLVLSVAIFLLRAGNITSGDFIMFFGYISLVFSPFFRLNQFYRQYKVTNAYIKRILDLNIMDPEAMKHGDRTPQIFSGKIDFENVIFKYDKGKEVLRGINLRINSGESVALVGESGVGKTTLSELVLGYYQPEKGKVLFDGEDLSQLKLNWIRNQIAIVPQEISIFNDTLLNNLKIAKPNAKFEEVVKAAKLANAHEFIMSLPKKYKTLVGERGVKLSVGQKQRIAITMAFLKNPKILILDEPTASLDAKSEREVQKGIEKLMEGRTTIIIAHRFSTVENANKIAVLDKGKVIEVGNHKELMKKKGKYYELYRLQRGVE